MHKLNPYINQLEVYSSRHQTVNLEVSNGSIGWHIEHTLKVISRISEALEKSNTKEYVWKFNFGRYFILAINKIPRGKGVAPKVVIPEGNITSESLKNSISNSREAIKKIESLKPAHFFTHPYFGDLNLRTSKRFLDIHTKHHIKIISDIIKAS